MKIVLKRDNSTQENVVGVVLLLIGLAIIFYPFITGYDMLDGGRNLLELVVFIASMLGSAYMLVDLDETIKSIGIDEEYDEYDNY